MAKIYNSFSFLNVQSIQSLNFPSVCFSNCKHIPPPPPSTVPGHRRQSARLLGLPWPPGKGHMSFLMIGNPALGSNESFQPGVLMVPLLGVRNPIVAQVVMSPPLILTSSFFWLTGSCQHSCVPRPGYEATSLIPPNFMVRDESGDVDMGQITPGLPWKGRNLDFT